MLELVSRSPEETFEIARRLGSALAGGAVLALVGELGSGKTLFTKGLACGLGVAAHHRVNSPTFVILQEYVGRLRIHHYDVYRLRGAEDLAAIGFEEDLDDPQMVVVVEWADRVAELLPPAALTVAFEHPAPPPGALGPPGAAPDAPPRSRRLVFSGLREAWGATLELLKN
jgi:tRNA threonylcarbamoyladenosine biosynthesis protein TsaE